MVGYLVESALLTHGLKSISDEELILTWPHDDAAIAWIEKGRLITGGIEKFCAFRRKASHYGRVNYFNYDRCMTDGGGRGPHCFRDNAGVRGAWAAPGSDVRHGRTYERAGAGGMS